MPLDPNFTGSPPAVDAELVAKWQRLATDIDAALGQGGERGMELLLSLIPDWCEAAEDINAARQICVEMAMKGLRDEALQWHAEHFDETARRLTNRPGWDAWENELIRRGVAVPKFDHELMDLYDRIFEDMKGLDLAGVSLKDRLAQLRRNMIARGPVDERLRILQAIKRLQPGDSIWDDMIAPIRQERVGRVAAEVTAAVNAVDFVRLENLREEVAGWGGEVLGPLAGVLEASLHWQKAFECKGGMSTAAVAFKGEVEKLKSKTFGSPAYAKALEDARVALERLNQVRASAREAIDTARRVPAIHEHLKANGVIDAFNNVNAGIRATEDEFRDHHVRKAAIEQFLRPEASIREHVDSVVNVIARATEQFKIEGPQWIERLGKLRRKVEVLQTKTGMAMPASLREKLEEGAKRQQEIEKRLGDIRRGENRVIAIVIVVILSILIGTIALLIFNGPGSRT